MLKLILLLMVIIGSSSAQIGVISRFPPQLKQYLELTDEQVTQILRLNEALSRYQFEKNLRISTVYAELAAETAKTTVDPMALGLRHLELESIRRELMAESQKTATEIAKLLAPAQKTNLEALKEVERLQPVVCEAQAVNLLGAPTPIRQPFPGNIIPANRLSPAFGLGCAGFASFLLGTIPQP